MKDYQLNDINSEDLDDLLLKIEKSFDIKFEDNELEHIITFGEFCDHIANKIPLEDSNDCTIQQAFYKLRNAIEKALNIEQSRITKDTLLTDILPRHNRISMTRKLEKHLGFKLSIIRPPYFITITLGLTVLASFIGFFINWQVGLLGLAFSIGGIWISDKFGKELDLKTVGEVAKKMTRENYLKTRRNSKTFSKKEIEKVLTDWFSEDLYIDKSKLTRDAKFV